MITGMQKDIVSGVLALSGITLVLVAAEASLPVLAGVGAVAALGAGVYQVATSPKRRDKTPYTSTYTAHDSAIKTAGRRY